MIRKAIIVLLTLSSVATLVLAYVSFQEGRTKFHPWPEYQLSVKDGRFFVGHIFPQGQSGATTLSSPFMRGVWFSYDRFPSFTIVSFPLWVPIFFFLTYPIIAFIRGPLRRWRRRRRGECLACGYNLTGNVSSVCPECGTKVERQP